MVVNPALKPKVATTGLVLTSAVVLIFLALVPLAILASELPTLIKIVLASVLLASALMLLWLWWKRYAKRRTWAANAEARWRSFNNARATSGTTTEVTLLSIDAVQPTGSWVTIMWNRFNHIQPAWIEPLPEPVWVGHVLLIAPDPTQVMPGAPWPATYSPSPPSLPLLPQAAYRRPGPASTPAWELSSRAPSDSRVQVPCFSVKHQAAFSALS